MNNNLLSLLDAVIWEANPNTFEFITVSPQLAAWLKRPLTAVTHWTDAIYEPDKQWVVDLLQQKIGIETEFQLQYRLHIPHRNTVRWVQDRITVILENGRIQRLCGIRLPQGHYTENSPYSPMLGQPSPTKPQFHIANSLPLNAPITLEFETTAREALQYLQPLLQFDAALIYFKPYHESNYLFATIGHPDEAALKPAFFNMIETDGILQEIARTKQPIVIDDVRQIQNWTWLPHATHIRALLGVPLFGHQKEEMMGAFLCDSSQVAFFQTVDLEMLKGLVHYLSLALDNAHLYPRELRRRQMAEVLNQIATSLTSTLDIDEVMARTVETVGHILPDIQTCTISILEQEGTYLRMHKTWFRDDSYKSVAESEGAYVADTYACRQVLEKRSPFIMTNIQNYSQFKVNKDLAETRQLSALLYVPLMAYREPIGILHVHVWDQQPREFTSEEVSLCQSLANYAAIALENARLFAAERRQLRLSQMLQRVGSMLTMTLTLEMVYEELFDFLAEVVAFDSVSIQLIDRHTGQLHLAAGRGFTDLEAMRQFVSSLREASLKKIGNPPYWCVIPDTWNDDKWHRGGPATYIRSWIGAALLIKGEIIGILNVDSTTCYAYDDELGQVVAAFANQAAAAIENARLHEETNQKARELSILHKVAENTAVTLDVDYLLHQTTQTITQSLYPNLFSFVMVDENTGCLRPHASSYGIPSQFYDTNIPYENSVAGHVVKTGQPYLVENTETEARYFPGSQDSRSEVAVPVIVNGRVIAAINVESPQIAAFDKSDVRFLVTLANQVATAIERARLYRTLHQQAESLARQVATRTAELEAEKERTLAILENAGEGIIFTDPNTIMLYANTALEQQSGYQRSQLLGQPLATLIDTHKEDAVYQEMQAAIAACYRWSGELLSRHQDGNQYDISLTITPIQSSDGLIGFVGILSNITRLKELERLKTKFVSNVSHELRTPLTNIKTYLTLLERGSKAKRDRYLQILNHETDRLTYLIQDLLNLSRLETEPLPQVVEPIDLSRLLHEFFEIFQPKAEKKGMILRLLPLSDLPLVLVEEHHLAQLLSNFLGNALAYIRRGDEITIQAGRTDLKGRPAVWFTVADTGPGIDAEDLPRLFDRFYRGQRVQELNMPGTGLGLAICNEIVSRYNGRLEVDTAPGEGTAFTVYLPAKP